MWATFKYYLKSPYENLWEFSIGHKRTRAFCVIVVTFEVERCHYGRKTLILGPIRNNGHLYSHAKRPL